MLYSVYIMNACLCVIGVCLKVSSVLMSRLVIPYRKYFVSLGIEEWLNGRSRVLMGNPLQPVKCQSEMLSNAPHLGKMFVL